MTILNIYSLDDTEQERVIASLTDGKHVIGRGDLLKVTDKRVSRNHASIEVCSDKITLTSLHINPCFFKAGNGQALMVIIQNQVTELEDGDQFSLLPEDYWFRVRIVRNVGKELHSGKRLHEPHLDDSNTVSSPKKAKLLSSTVSHSNSYAENNVSETRNTDESLDNEESNYSASHLQETARLGDLEQENIIEEPVESNGEEEPASSSSAGKITDNSNNAPPEIQIEDTDQQRPNGSGLQAPATRERCWYGERCFRKNPNHRETFSHPGDEDYDTPNEDDRPECPYGVACYRRNPEHRRQYKHHTIPAPKPNQPPTSSPPTSPDAEKTTPNKKQPKRKAATKKTDPEVAHEDDYDYEDPFINDGSSDDFEPSDYGIDSSDSDCGDSREVDDEARERQRMLREAKKFTGRG